MKVDDRGILTALKFETDDCDTCLDLKWNTYGDDGQWKYIDIENNNAIVGLCADLEVNDENEGIHKLGFMLATEENCVTEPPKAPTEINENILTFGTDTDYKLVQKYPKSSNDLKKMTQPVKLTAIKWKQYNDDDVLSAIQLIFNTHKTPMFAARDSEGFELRTTKIDPEKRIATIMVRVYRGYQMAAFKLISDQDEIICEEDLAPGYGEWTSHEIPEGEQLIGIATSDPGEGSSYFYRLGFITGSPA